MRLAIGNGKTCTRNASTDMAGLVDTNILVYRVDRRFLAKRKIAMAFLRSGLEQDELRITHQSIVEFIAAVTRPRGKDGSILSIAWWPKDLSSSEEYQRQLLAIAYGGDTSLRYLNIFA